MVNSNTHKIIIYFPNSVVFIIYVPQFIYLILFTHSTKLTLHPNEFYLHGISTRKVRRNHNMFIVVFH